MGALGVAALERQLARGSLHSVYYLTGDEDVLKDEVLQLILDVAVPPETREFNLDDRRAPDLDLERFHTLVNTPPLLGGRRAVVVRGIEAWKRKPKLRDLVARYAAAPAPDTVLVLVQGTGEKVEPTLARHATVVALDPLPPERAVEWIKRRADRMHLAIDQEAIDLLVAAGGGDLSHVASELVKLSAAFGDLPAAPGDVAEMVGVRHGETLDDLVDAVMSRDAARAVQLVDPVLAQPGVTGVRVVTALGTALLGTRATRARYDRGARGAALERAAFTVLARARPAGLGSWKAVAARWASWVPRWSDQELSRALRRALRADRGLKAPALGGDAAEIHGLVLAISTGAAA